MANSRKQPKTIDIERVVNRDKRQEAKNKTKSEKKATTRFNSGFDTQAVFAAISQLLETFTSQVLDYTSANMSMLLRTIYRNLDDDMIGILSEEENVKALNEYLSQKNEEIAEAVNSQEQQEGQEQTVQNTQTNKQGHTMIFMYMKKKQKKNI